MTTPFKGNEDISAKVQDAKLPAQVNEAHSASPFTAIVNEAYGQESKVGQQLIAKASTQQPDRASTESITVTPLYVKATTEPGVKGEGSDLTLDPLTKMPESGDAKSQRLRSANDAKSTDYEELSKSGELEKLLKTREIEKKQFSNGDEFGEEIHTMSKFDWDPLTKTSGSHEAIEERLSKKNLDSKWREMEPKVGRNKPGEPSLEKNDEN